jgi:hypothetical protein
VRVGGEGKRQGSSRFGHESSNLVGAGDTKSESGSLAELEEYSGCRRKATTWQGPYDTNAEFKPLKRPRKNWV